MLNLITHSNSEIELKNSIWMFNPNPMIFYSGIFDFVRFNNQNEIEYLNGKGELMEKCTLELDANKVYKIKGNPIFKGFEIVDATQMNLVFETRYHMEWTNTLITKM